MGCFAGLRSCVSRMGKRLKTNNAKKNKNDRIRFNPYAPTVDASIFGDRGDNFRPGIYSTAEVTSYERAEASNRTTTPSFQTFGKSSAQKDKSISGDKRDYSKTDICSTSQVTSQTETRFVERGSSSKYKTFNKSDRQQDINVFADNGDSFKPNIYSTGQVTRPEDAKKVGITGVSTFTTFGKPSNNASLERNNASIKSDVDKLNSLRNSVTAQYNAFSILTSKGISSDSGLSLKFKSFFERKGNVIVEEPSSPTSPTTPKQMFNPSTYTNIRNLDTAIDDSSC